MNAQLAAQMDPDRVLSAIATMFTEWHRLDKTKVTAVPEDRDLLTGKQRGIELCVSVLMNTDPGRLKTELSHGLGQTRRPLR